jgi:hypothetical protein
MFGPDAALDNTEAIAHANRSTGTPRQGITLVHYSAQRERFVWDRGNM